MSSKQHSAAARIKKPAKRRNRRTHSLWVSRDVTYEAYYNINRDEPPSFENGRWEIAIGGYAICNIEPETFEHLMGIKLKPGECRQFDMLVTITPVSQKGAK